MPPQEIPAVNPTVSGVLFESDTQTEDLGLAKDVTGLKKATPKQHEYVWGNIAWFLFLHVASLFGLYRVFTSAMWQTNVFGLEVRLAFESDTQTKDLGLAKDVTVLKKATPKQHEYVWGNIAWFLFLHVASLFELYRVFTSAMWQTNVSAFAVHLMCAIGIGAGSHRLWTHRCFKAKTPLRVLLMIWQTMGFQDCIFEWARDHRTHHKYADTDADPHNAERGLFFSHMGWLCVKKSPEVIEGGRRLDLSDLFADPVVMFQKKHYLKMMPILCFVLPTVIPVYFWGETWMNAFLIPTILRYTCGINVVWSVNSFAHIYGYRPYDKSLNPRENIGVWMICVEGFHNYHHTFPWDYRATEHALFNMLTPTIVFIELMAKIGQAYDLKSVTKDIIKQRSQRTGDGSHHLWGWDDPEFTDQLKQRLGTVTHEDRKTA